MELWIPPMRLFEDRSHFLKLAVAILGLVPVWEWATSESSVDPGPNCWQTQSSPLSVPACGHYQDMRSSGDMSPSLCTAIRYECVPGSYLQHVTLVMPNTTCPWSDLPVSSMQQCPGGTKSTEYQLSAADAFLRCTEIASLAIAVSPRTEGAGMAVPLVGACEIEVVDSVTLERRKYLVELPEYLVSQNKTPGNNAFLSAKCPNVAGCGERCNGASGLLRPYRFIRASSVYFLSVLKIDWRQKIHHWMKEHASLILKYFVTKLDGMLRLTKSAKTIMGLRLSYQQGFRNRLDSIGDLCQRTTRAISVPTISANRLLPQRSGWIFRKRVSASEKASPAEHTPEPVVNSLHESRRALDLHCPDVSESSDDFSSTMTWQLKLWDYLAHDIGKQSTMPGLRSGNTVIDERNFVLGRGW